MILLNGMEQEDTRAFCKEHDVSCVGTIGWIDDGNIYDRIQVIRCQGQDEKYYGFYHVVWDKFVDPSEVAGVIVSGSASYVDGAWISGSTTNLVRTKGSERDHEDCLTALKAAATWAQ